MINDLDIVQWAYLLDPAFQLVNSAGKPLTDGWIEVYIHGTRNKYYCASDFDGTLHPFKIPLDSLGSNIVLASPDYAYDIYIYNKFGSLVMSRYNVVAGKGGGGSGGIPSQTEAQHWMGQYGATQALEGNERGQTLALPSRPDYQGDFVDHIDYGTINGDETNQYPKYMYLKPGIYLVNCVIRFQQQSGTEVNRLDETLVYTGNGNANEDIAWQLDETGPLATGDRHCLKLTFIRKVLDTGETSTVDCSNILYFAPAPQVNWSDAYIQTLQIVKLGAGFGSSSASGGVEYKAGTGISIDIYNNISVTGMQPASAMGDYVTYEVYNEFVNNVTGDINILQNEIDAVSAAVSGGVGPEYEEGYGIHIEDNTISVDPSIIPTGCVSQEEFAQVTGDIVNQIENVTGDVTEITNVINNVTGDITNLTEVVNNVTGDVQNLTTIVENVTGDINNLETIVNNVTGDINVLETNISNVSGDVINLTEVVEGVTGDITNLTEVVNNVTGDVTNLTEVVNNVTGDVHNLTDVVNGVTGDIEQLEIDIQTVSAAIPPAQVNSDWAATGGVAEILNKPEIETITAYELVAGEGVAIAEVSGQYVISASGQGGGDYTAGQYISIENETISVTGLDPQVNADWFAASGAAEILNKPVEANLVAGENITITASGSDIIISSQGGAVTGDYVTHAELDTAIDAATGLIPDVSNLATNADLQTVSAAVDEVSGQIPETEEVEFEELDLSQFVTESAVTALEADIQTVSSAIPDVSNLASKSEVQAVADDVQIVSAAIPDVSNFATESDLQTVSAAIPDVSNLATKAELATAVDTVTGMIPDTSNFATEAELQIVSAAIPDVSDFASQSDLQTVSAAVDSVSASIPESEEVEFEELDVSQFVTESAVTGLEAEIQIVSAAIPDTSTFATNADLQIVSAAIPDVAQADWAATGGPSEILNKPSEKNLVAGENVTISIDGDDVIVETTEMASGMQLVAGEGVKLTVSGNYLVAETDETVLWEGTITWTAGQNLNTLIQLSESILNFERIEVYGTGMINYITWHPSDRTGVVAYVAIPERDNNTSIIGATVSQETDKTRIRYRLGYKDNNWVEAYEGLVWGADYGIPYKVVGVKRIAS